jgi:hypothetical protein
VCYKPSGVLEITCEVNLRITPCNHTSTKKKQQVVFEVNQESMSIDSIERVNFSDVGWTEPNEIEELVSKNLEKFIREEGEEENLLIVGRQVRDKSRGRNDLVALNGHGDILLIEIKRDEEDQIRRKENIEGQAIRYASSLAKIESPEELLDKMYRKYYEKYEVEDDKDKEEDPARKNLYNFLNTNDINFNSVNGQQRIVLFASGYSKRSLSSLAWLSKNGVDITVLEGSLFKYGDQLMLDVNQLLPVADEEDYLIDIIDKKSSTPSKSSSGSRSQRPRVSDMMDEDLISKGDELRIPTEDGKPEATATLLDSRHVKVDGEKRSTNQWAKDVKGWDSVSIYREVEHVESGDVLNNLREEIE